MITNSEQEALNLAINYANDFTIGIAGVTRENSVVISEECIRYRRGINDLKYEANGNWIIETTIKSSKWKQLAPAKIIKY
jgi:hypothetical protein